MIIYDCLKCCLVVRNLGDGFFLRIFMQHYEYKTLSKCKAFVFCTKKYPRKTGAALVLAQLPNWSAAVRTCLGILTQRYNASITKPVSNKKNLI